MDKKKTLIKKYWPIAVAALGAILMLLPFSTEKKEAPETSAQTESCEDTELYSERLEKRITELICSAKGVGKAQVVITLDSTEESVMAQNSDISSGKTAIDYVIINGSDGQETVPIARIYPKVRGVAVVCTGGGDPQVRKLVTELISAALGISSSRIAVSG